MIKVVIDANVFVSAVLKPGSKPDKIIAKTKAGKLKLLVSPDILLEVKTTLLYPRLKKLHRLTGKEVDEFLRALVMQADITPGELIVEAIKDDPSDNIYLACAVEGKADFIISGDRHLKDLKTFGGIRIVDPATFLEIIAKPTPADKSG